jgi:small subunit ribosomal protein S16
MGLVIRLRQQGRRNRQSYRLVVSDVRSPRDGKYLEKLGFYDPFMPGEKNYSIEKEKVMKWLTRGAQLSERAKILLKKAEPEMMKEITETKEKRKARIRKKNKKK